MLCTYIGTHTKRHTHTHTHTEQTHTHTRTCCHRPVAVMSPPCSSACFCSPAATCTRHTDMSCLTCAWPPECVLLCSVSVCLCVSVFVRECECVCVCLCMTHRAEHAHIEGGRSLHQSVFTRDRVAGPRAMLRRHGRLHNHRCWSRAQDVLSCKHMMSTQTQRAGTAQGHRGGAAFACRIPWPHQCQMPALYAVRRRLAPCAAVPPRQARGLAGVAAASERRALLRAF